MKRFAKTACRPGLKAHQVKFSDASKGCKFLQPGLINNKKRPDALLRPIKRIIIQNNKSTRDKRAQQKVFCLVLGGGDC
jgi:hypothetical protein